LSTVWSGVMTYCVGVAESEEVVVLVVENPVVEHPGLFSIPKRILSIPINLALSISHLLI
jgi:hypothetical protein